MQEHPNANIEAPGPRQENTDLLVIAEEKELREIDGDSDKVNNEVYDFQVSKYSVTQRELQDIKMNSSAKGHLKYWRLRLATEIDILPDEVGEAVKRWIETKKAPVGKDLSVIEKYINRRVSVLDFQIRKRKEMITLKKDLRNIDKRKESPGANLRIVFYDDVAKKMFVVEKDAKKEITYGDIVAVVEWGIKYTPDASTPDNIWRKIRKLIAIKVTRKNIESIFNDELARTEEVGLPTSSWSLEFLEKHATEGVVAERMAENYLRRQQYDQKDLNIKIESSNAMEDSVLKYDFKISMPDKYRGIAVEGEEMKREAYVKYKRKLGIQFTTNAQAEEHKLLQIEGAKKDIDDQKFLRFMKRPVDDIVLVTLPFGTFKQYFKRWINEGKPSGGPEQYFTQEEKNAILNAVLVK